MGQDLGPELVKNGGVGEGAVGRHFTGPYGKGQGADGNLGAEVVDVRTPSGRGSLRIEIVAFGPDHAVCDPNGSAKLRCTVRNAGGQVVKDVVGVLSFQGRSRHVALGDLNPGLDAPLEMPLHFAITGVQTARARFTAANAKPCRQATSVVSLPRPGKRSLRLSSGHAELRFLDAPMGHGVVEVVARKGQDSRVIGMLRSLGSLQIDDSPRPELIYAQLRKEGQTVFGTWQGQACDLSFAFEPLRPGWFATRCELKANRDLRLRALTCPELHIGCGGAGVKKDSALFCGLEYLTADEQSSGTESVAPDLAARFVPHPNKVTVPLMAVANEGWAAGIAWDPLQTWDGHHDRPSAVFASPNRLDAQLDHLMAVFVPSVGRHVAENTRAARRGLALERGASIVLRAEIFVLPVTENVCEVLPAWYKTHPVPELPDLSRNHRRHWAHSVAARLQGWSDERKQWRPEAHRDYAWAPDIALRLYNYAIHNQDGLAGTAMVQAKAAIEKAIADGGPGRLGLPLSLHAGHVAENLGGLGHGSHWLSQQRPDGSWPFIPNEKTKSLGKRGDTALGICCGPILDLLRVARQTGHRRSLEAALKGLEYVEAHFRRPAGGETWEVPLHAPNLRAAALAVECYVAAYELTGDAKHLARARYWANSGLPFVYTWNAPDRPAMRYATISVFGATFHTHPWFGRAVQWVGMVYSRALQRLAPYDKTFPWGRIAEGIVMSCIQQQHMGERRQANNPMPGSFPDVYDLLDGKVYPAWIGPQGIIESLENLLDRRPTDIRLIGTRPTQIRLISAAKILSASLADKQLTAELHYPAERTSHSLLTCIARPDRVLLDGRSIFQTDALERVPIGWWVDADRHCVVVKHVSRHETMRLVIEPAQFAPSDSLVAAPRD